MFSVGDKVRQVYTDPKTGVKRFHVTTIVRKTNTFVETETGAWYKHDGSAYTHEPVVGMYTLEKV